ncbi:glycoside hydrolase family 2 [candidate division KSB1 bacterium]|nr:glycoside hydrolase family 2 [candidate division KSB1 bacterium]RQW11803.1 MAG: glycoside hydrolase family 2 [candidate division KSB1 bacterium]
MQKISFIFIVSLCALAFCTEQGTIPLPEHPRPDFSRPHWMNLNGVWAFEFDGEDVGLTQKWFAGAKAFSREILVPFPWGSKLSGVPDEAVIGWYERAITVPRDWQGERVFVVFGAGDWHTTGWLDGEEVGQFKGGYTPFEFEITDAVRWGAEQRLRVRIDDTEHKFKLYGKQGYGDARGIWQTVYLEARPHVYLEKVHFYPDIDRSRVDVKAFLSGKPTSDGVVEVNFQTGDVPLKRSGFKRGMQEIEFSIEIPDQRLWSLEDPFLYEVDAILDLNGGRDVVATYFGMRKISVAKFPGADYSYIHLNDKPVYLQLALDQAYHPDGFYTYPSDAFMRDEILRSRRIGLNGQRVHVKIEIPRKLYWADKLGFLIMADVPNSWGEPDENMQREVQVALDGMVERDFNHPCIFSWVLFNETWGLFSGEGSERRYSKETQAWVEKMYNYAKKQDPTRLVEDNSPCNYDHVATDINSWHAYLPGYAWRAFLDEVSAKTFKHSSWNFVQGKSQLLQPNINSECGNVWGYQGSTGDVDWSWDYHRMLNEFRRHPKIAGWLYTEHHDVINEWNGYYKYDRSQKYTGFDALLPGMQLNDLHSEFYISTGQDICLEAAPGETVAVPIYASFMTDRAVGEELLLSLDLYGWDDLGEYENYGRQLISVPFEPWLQKEFEPVRVTLPKENTVCVLSLTLQDRTGTVLQRNFVVYVVSGGVARREEIRTSNDSSVKLVRFAPSTFSAAEWSGKQWAVFDGLKVNGAGSGYFEYRVKWPDLAPEQIAAAALRFEASAKQLFGKDRGAQVGGDYMRGKGTFDNSANANAYPMTDENCYPSAVRIRVNGVSLGVFDIEDDPADSRGILSWHAQKQDGKLQEAGSYGYLITAKVPPAALQDARQQNEFVIRFEVDESLPHGLALYGERFGRYMLDPTLIFQLR